MIPSVSEMQLDALREVINIGVGRAAATLNEMLQKHVSLQIPDVTIIELDGLDDALGTLNSERLSSVRLGFSGEFSGMASLVFPPDSAAKLVDALTDSAPSADMDSLRIATLSEVGNIVINGVMGSLSNMMSLHLNYTLPSYTERRLNELLVPDSIDDEGPILIARTHFHIEELALQGVIYLLFTAGSFQLLLDHIDKLIAE